MVCFDVKIFTLLFALFVYLHQTNVDVKQRTVSVETVVYNVSLENTFDFISNPDGFDKWFRWIPRAYSADHRPFGVNKKYIINFVSSIPIVFTVKELQIYDDRVKFSLEGDALIKPNIEFLMYETGKYLGYARVKIKISLILNRSSYLFKLSVGHLIQDVAKARMKEALTHLNYIFVRLYRGGYKML